MTTYTLNTDELCKETIQKLNVGDIIYLTGTLYTARDRAQQLLLSTPQDKLPFDPTHLPIYHCGPLAKKTNESWSIISCGPTTSSRLEETQSHLIKKYHIPLLIGKGGMGSKTAQSLKDNTSVYTTYTGGCGALAAERIAHVEHVYYLQDLGMAEAIWILKIKEFGPLLVSMDSKGKTLYSRK